MAEAYSSLVSVMKIIDQIMYHGRNSFSLNQEQIESIRERAAYLVSFLEWCSYGEVESLESQISDASHAAEDVIESKVVDYIRKYQSTSTFANPRRSNPLCEQLQQVIQDLDLMKQEAMKVKEKPEVQVQLPNDSIPFRDSSSSSHDSKDIIMVGLDDVLEKLGANQNDLRIIPITGMGGIGKTTLTRNVYESRYAVDKFDFRAWVTISQKYEIENIFKQLLDGSEVDTGSKSSENELGHALSGYLYGSRYLIVIDDICDTVVWDKLQLFFPENNNKSRIIITTRETKMFSHLGSPHEMQFLGKEQSWNLFRQKVFGKQECADLELEKIGRKIAKNCKGLPLSIIVIGGLLANLDRTRENWDRVAKELNSELSQAEDGRCSRVLSLSYNNMPVHLKPCFLYMGLFPEDDEINVSQLIKLWVAEGFLKQDKSKSLEQVAMEYLIGLTERNLIMVHEQGSRGNIKTCKIHDLLRDLCIREAQKGKFLTVAKSFDGSQVLQDQRRIVIDGIKNGQTDSVSLLRSITFHTESNPSFFGGKLIRILNGESESFSEIVLNLVNLRYANFTYCDSSFFMLPFTMLWNLQTLIIQTVEYETTVLPGIWEMKQLRHLKADEVYLPQPSTSSLGENLHLQTLKGICNLSLSEAVVKKISNIKKFHISWTYSDKKKNYYCLTNLPLLHELESLNIEILYGGDLQKVRFLKNLTFPHSLKKLVLSDSRIPWENMTIIGCLPNLEVLKLKNEAFVGEIWKPVEGQFPCLKYLDIEGTDDLEIWNADESHFPVLEQLRLFAYSCAIPLGIAKIATLELIQLLYCRDSVVQSAINILDEQEDQGNIGAQVKFWVWKDKTKLENLEEREKLEAHYVERAQKKQRPYDSTSKD